MMSPSQQSKTFSPEEDMFVYVFGKCSEQYRVDKGGATSEANWKCLARMVDLPEDEVYRAPSQWQQRYFELSLPGRTPPEGWKTFKADEFMADRTEDGWLPQVLHAKWLLNIVQSERSCGKRRTSKPSPVLLSPPGSPESYLSNGLRKRRRESDGAESNTEPSVKISSLSWHGLSSPQLESERSLEGTSISNEDRRALLCLPKHGRSHVLYRKYILEHLGFSENEYQALVPGASPPAKPDLPDFIPEEQRSLALDYWQTLKEHVGFLDEQLARKDLSELEIVRMVFRSSSHLVRAGKCLEGARVHCCSVEQMPGMTKEHDALMRKAAASIAEADALGRANAEAWGFTFTPYCTAVDAIVEERMAFLNMWEDYKCFGDAISATRYQEAMEEVLP
jgi:hypothetical protein